jgi:hypothetical protein
VVAAATIVSIEVVDCRMLFNIHNNYNDVVIVVRDNNREVVRKVLSRFRVRLSPVKQI